MSAAMPLSAVDIQGRAMRCSIELVSLPQIGERLILTFFSDVDDNEMPAPVLLMPCDALALGKALEMFA